MKAILAGWAWIPDGGPGGVDPAEVKAALTLRPRVPKDYEPEEGVEPVEAWALRDFAIGVPRGWYVERFGGVGSPMLGLVGGLLDERTSGEAIEDKRLAFAGAVAGHERWEEQGRAVEAVARAYAVGDVGGIVQAVPAWGKTAFAIRTICRLGRRALVGVHKEFLLDQWRRRLETLAPGLRVGEWRGDKMDLDADVVLAMVQTVANREVPDEVASTFGLCVWDEVHRVGARTWSTVPPKFRPRYHLGLSARPHRADGMDDLIRWLVGPVVFKAAYVTPVPKVRRIATIYKRPRWIRKVEDEPGEDGKRGRIPYPTHLKAMTLSPTRTGRIVAEVERILRTSHRKVVVMSERVLHLDAMAEMLREADLREPIPDLSVGFIHSKIPKAAQADAEGKRLVFATFQMLEEGFDIPALDTLVLATPRASVEQPIGRIRRECVVGRTVTDLDCRRFCPWRVGRCVSKPVPIVVEFVDPEVGAADGKTRWRTRYYKEIGAEVSEGR